MAFPTVAYKHAIQNSGNVQSESPDALGRTPANIISGDSTAYSAAQLLVVATDDDTQVNNQRTADIETTKRSNHMFIFAIAGTLASIDDFMRFKHTFGTGNESSLHTLRLYIWNALLLSWEQLDSETSNDTNRILTGPAAGPNFSDYVDGSNNLHILLWDFEGRFRTAGGGCVRADTLVHTTEGIIAASAVKLSDSILSREAGQTVERKVEWIGHYYPKDRLLTRLTVLGWGEVVVTSNHQIPTDLGLVRADDVEGGTHRMLGLDGEWYPLTVVEHFTESCHVYDIWTRGPHFMAGAGLAVGVMDRE